MKNEIGVPSPCIDICDLDQNGQYCLGCLRTLDEIAGWSEAGDEERRAILARLAERKARRLSSNSHDL